MPDTFKIVQELDHISSPITALAYLHTQSTTLLLAGEGPLLRIFDDAAHQLIGTLTVFRTQAIHGIQVPGNVGNNAAESAVPYVLVWGGRSVCCIGLEPIIAGSQGRLQIQFHSLVSETFLSDWIFDACFLSTQCDADTTDLDVLVLTAHNVLLLLNVPDPLNEASARKYVMKKAVVGSQSVLYSGHVILLASGKVLIAAGTVFGEVLLWTCNVEEVLSMSMQMRSSLLHHTFLGHEGSIFGVRISDRFPIPGSDAVQRILASCSDDRTIRIWDISDVTIGTSVDWQDDVTTTSVETGFTTSSSQASQASSNLLAVAMGHKSRIWGVRFLSRRDSIQQLITYGEDASLQVWEIDLPSSEGSSSKMLEILPRELRHLDTYRFHSGKHIWSVACLAADDGPWKISTGGADGSIAHYNVPFSRLHDQCGRFWSTPTKFQRLGLDSQDSFKSYAWVSDVEFLVISEQGYILLGTLQSADQLSAEAFKHGYFSQVVSWDQLTQLDHLKSYCITTSVGEFGIAFLSGTEGTIYLYQHCGRSITPLISLPRKVQGLFAQALNQKTDAFQPLSSLFHIGMVASCLGSTIATAIVLEVNPSRAEDLRSSIVRTMTLILPSTFIVTSAGFTNSQKLVVLGSRSGALAFYDFSAFSDDKTGITVSYCVRHVHGEEAITAIKSAPLARSAADASSRYMLTTGRDGRYAVHHWKLEPGLQASNLTLETVHVGTPSFGPNIEGAVFQQSTQELLLWGFRTKNFVVWNHTKQREVMAIECGGTHRSWAFSPGTRDARSRMRFVCTRASICHVHSRPRASHKVLQDGGHGREFKALAISPLQDDDGGVCSRLVASGAEDTAIRIFSYKSSTSDVQNSSLHCIGTFSKHTAGLQQLQWSKDGQYLFSTAGCEEFYAWKVQPLPLFGIGVVCDARCPVKSVSADLRIMDFDVVDLSDEDKASDKTKHRFLITMVYSDSSVRVYCFDPLREQDKFDLLTGGTYGTSCLTQALTIHLGHEFYLCTAGTDGHIAFWPLSAALREQGIIITKNQLYRSTTSAKKSPGTPITWTSRTHIHQNSIKGMTVVHLSGIETILATAGDDNALAFTRLTSSPTTPTRTPSSSTLLIPHAHAAAITAVHYLGPVPGYGPSSTLSRHRFATSGPDQRLKFWLLGITNERAGAEGMQVTKVGNSYTTVADVACLDAFEECGKNGGRVFVAGIGVEVWRTGEREDLLGTSEEVVVVGL